MPGKRISVNEHLFYPENIHSEIPYYILGLWFADGNLHSNRPRFTITQTEQDKNIIFQIQKVLAPKALIEIRPMGKRSSQQSYALRFTNPYLYQRFIDLGCPPKKSLILRWPQWLEPKLTHHFIRGYIDGDGCVSQGFQLRITIAGTENFLTGLRDFLREQLGILENRQIYKSSQSKIKILVIAGRLQFLKFVPYLWEDSKIYGQRKYNKALKLYTENKGERVWSHLNS